ncbi:hypothetical protein [Pseudarthrobacter siccitolerans]|nr:hypothetical protein [Pseudarthrobacter siccitolerans]
MTQTASRPMHQQLRIAGHGSLPQQAAIPAAAVPEMCSRDVWLASSYLESVQWELDAAHESLLQAVRRAAEAGADPRELCKAANITPGELDDILKPGTQVATQAAS